MKKKDLITVLFFLTAPLIVLWLIIGYVEGDLSPYSWDKFIRFTHICVSLCLSVAGLVKFYGKE